MQLLMLIDLSIEDPVFSLQQALKMYDAVQERIAAYEQEILRKLSEMEREEQRGQTAPPLNNTNKVKAIKRRGQEGVVGHVVGKASEALQCREVEQQRGRAGNDGRRPEREGEGSRT